MNSKITKPSDRSQKYREKLFIRPEEVKPVAAWVLPVYSVENNAEVSAAEEERKLREIQISKEIKLKHFQSEVKKRLAIAAKQDHEHQREHFLKSAKEKHKLVSRKHYEPGRGNLERTEGSMDICSVSCSFKENSEDIKHSPSYKELSRRAFMESEREQVKENLRRLEVKRRQIEEQSLERLKMSVRVCKNTAYDISSEEENDRELMNNEIAKEQELSSTDRQSESDELFRSIASLKQDLLRKFENSTRLLPQLCLCSPNFLLTDPQSCANNCMFYRNPKALFKVLKCLESS